MLVLIVSGERKCWKILNYKTIVNFELESIGFFLPFYIFYLHSFDNFFVIGQILIAWVHFSIMDCEIGNLIMMCYLSCHCKSYYIWLLWLWLDTRYLHCSVFAATKMVTGHFHCRLFNIKLPIGVWGWWVHGWKVWGWEVWSYSFGLKSPALECSVTLWCVYE